MTDHAQQARELVKKINSQRNRIAGGYEIPHDELGPVALITAALEQAAQEVLNHPDYQACCERRQELYDQLQAAQPVWGNKAPGVTGWFFHRETSESPYRPIEIVMANYTGALQPWVIDGSERRPLACVVLEGGEWAGPIPLPMEA